MGVRSAPAFIFRFLNMFLFLPYILVTAILPLFCDSGPSLRIREEKIKAQMASSVVIAVEYFS